MSAPTIGALRRHFVVEAPVAGADGMLNHEIRFLAWGAIEPSQTGVTIRLRARAGFDTGWRLRCGARVFEIVTRKDDETASGFIACACKEIAP
jgi:head-tail adaptor